MPVKTDLKSTTGVTDADEAFTDFYLKQATKEFSDDLDKLRAAPDFKANSLDILIDALKQGQACFEKEEREKIGRSLLELEQGRR